MEALSQDPGIEVARQSVRSSYPERTTSPASSPYSSAYYNDYHKYDQESRSDKQQQPPSSATYFGSSPQAPPHSPSGLEPRALYEKHQGHENRGRGRQRRSPWLLPAAIAAGLAALVVGAAVGGGLGATLQTCRSDLRATSTELNALQAYGCTKPDNAVATSGNPASPPTPTTSSSEASVGTFQTTADGLMVNYVPPGPSTIDSLSVDCLALGRQEQSSSANEKFKVHCGVDLGWGSRTAESGTGTVVVADMVAVMAYDLATCVDACSSYNTFAARFKTGDECKAVSFRWDMAEAYARNGVNCWLKNATASIEKARPCGSRCLTAVRVF
ncbi:uncharacterized protein B0I36DRAFT_368052 [Microdochium trichocladiopsis]|uniref:Apple domain-containing protein n=1 Tax=Microdochium trichocladiopsis TaxID=1682393 RepID=A0A9P8XU72_9PEZI|nr:uncharacterized protein B0I36DRAFT_368052 [Microdochium trichocladiopsis]KAH7017996.1 hypothetical protein B0I36DRAFT_368052 [Microdochium trichocladiopsis]